jgi:hypothetical protein
MTDELTPDSQPEAPLDPLAAFEQFKAEYPGVALAVEEEIKRHVQSAEQRIGAHHGETKQQDALTNCLTTLYDGADIFFGFPGPVDALLKTIVIPAIPGLIDGAAAWFHSQGIFSKVG